MFDEPINNNGDKLAILRCMSLFQLQFCKVRVPVGLPLNLLNRAELFIYLTICSFELCKVTVVIFTTEVWV